MDLGHRGSVPFARSAFAIVLPASQSNNCTVLIIHRNNRALHQRLIEFDIGIFVLDVVYQFLHIWIHVRVNLHRSIIWIFTGFFDDFVNYGINIVLIILAVLVGDALFAGQLIGQFYRFGQIGLFLGDITMIDHHIDYFIASCFTFRKIIDIGAGVTAVWIVFDQIIIWVTKIRGVDNSR